MDKQYLYDLVQFSSSKKKIKDIECLPLFWVTFDKNTKKCSTKYPPPHYKPKTFKQLHQMVENRDKPNEDWPTFYVTIKGQPRSYEEGMKKLLILQTEQYAFLNADVPRAEQTAQIEHDKHQEQLRKEAQSMLAQMQLSIKSANLMDDTIDSSSDNEYEKSSDENKPDNPINKKRKSLKSRKCPKRAKTTASPVRDMKNETYMILPEYHEHKQELQNEESRNVNLDIVDLSSPLFCPEQLVTRKEFNSFQYNANIKLTQILENQKHILELLESQRIKKQIQ